MELASPNLKIPLIVTGWAPIRVLSAAFCPTFRFLRSARALSTATSPCRFGNAPATSVFELNRSLGVENTSGGAPPAGPADLPSTTSAPSAPICPSASATPGTFCTFVTSDSGSGPGCCC